MTELDRDEIIAKVRTVLVESLRLDETPGLDDRLVEDLGAESVDLISLVFELEEKLGREIADEDLPKLTSIRAIVDLVAGPPDPKSPSQ